MEARQEEKKTMIQYFVGESTYQLCYLNTTPDWKIFLLLNYSQPKRNMGNFCCFKIIAETLNKFGKAAALINDIV